MPMTTQVGDIELSPDALAVADSYCPIHRGLHAFELVLNHAGTQLQGATLPTGEVATHGLRSPFPCSVQQPVDLHRLESETAQERWRDTLSLENALATDPESVATETRLQLLTETLVALNNAFAVPSDRVNRLIAKHLAFAVGAFAACFIGLVTLHWILFAYLSVLCLVGAIFTPFVSNRCFTRRWRQSVLALAPPALAPLGVTPEQIRDQLDAASPPLRRLHRPRNLDTILTALAAEPDARPSLPA